MPSRTDGLLVGTDVVTCFDEDRLQLLTVAPCSLPPGFLLHLEPAAVVRSGQALDGRLVSIADMERLTGAGGD